MWWARPEGCFHSMKHATSKINITVAFNLHTIVFMNSDVLKVLINWTYRIVMSYRIVTFVTSFRCVYYEHNIVATIFACCTVQVWPNSQTSRQRSSTMALVGCKIWHVWLLLVWMIPSCLIVVCSLAGMLSKRSVQRVNLLTYGAWKR